MALHGMEHYEHPVLTEARELKQLPEGPVPEDYVVPKTRGRRKKQLEGQLSLFDNPPEPQSHEDLW